MAWISITEQDVESRLSGPELAASKSLALAPGQSGVLAEIIAQVVGEARGYVAAHASNTLGLGETLPQKLLGSALAMIRYRLATRLPVKSLLTDDRVKENDAAIRLMERVADGKYSVEEPTTAETEAAAAPYTSASSVTRSFTRDLQSGM